MLGNFDGDADGSKLGEDDGLMLGLTEGINEGASVLSQHSKNAPVSRFGQHIPVRPSKVQRGCDLQSDSVKQSPSPPTEKQ